MMKSVHILGLWALLRSFFLCLPSHISGKWTVHSRYQFERPAHMDRIGSFDMPVDRHTDAMAYQPKKFTLRGLTYCDGMQCPLPSVELYSGNEISFSSKWHAVRNFIVVYLDTETIWFLKLKLSYDDDLHVSIILYLLLTALKLSPVFPQRFIRLERNPSEVF